MKMIILENLKEKYEVFHCYFKYFDIIFSI
jgi:hypothetical protein